MEVNSRKSEVTNIKMEVDNTLNEATNNKILLK